MEWRLEWQESAECAKVDRDTQDCFFPDPEGDAKVIEHKEIVAQIVCYTCPVKVDCLIYAIETNEQYGVWGMHTQADRRELKRWMTRHPDKATYHWNRSFRKIAARIHSTLDAEAAEGVAFAPVEFTDRHIVDEALIVG